jgi:hypothetical protein
MRIYRKRKGASLTEFGPALIVLFFACFFPLLDLITIGISFGSAWYLNNLCATELSLKPQSQQANVTTSVNSAFVQTGISSFLGVTKPSQITHTINYADPGNGAPLTVTCTTVLSTKPFVTLQFLQKITGVSIPATFTMTTERPRENIQ